jgi:hypothetical protein
MTSIMAVSLIVGLAILHMIPSKAQYEPMRAIPVVVLRETSRVHKFSVPRCGFYSNL